MVLVRLGQQRLRHDHGCRALRAVPHLGRRARPRAASGDRRRHRLQVHDRPARPGARRSRPAPWSFYLVTAATILSAVVLPIVGAVADRSASKPRLLGGFAWAGSAMAALMFFVAGANWQFGAVLLVLATLFLGASLVVYDSILVEIADPDERDKVSSRGWALGYLGGGLLLAVNFVLLTVMSDHTEMAVRHQPAERRHLVGGVHDHPGARHPVAPARQPRRASRAAWWRASFGQLWHTLKDLRGYPGHADVPAGVPLLQRRHPDGDLRRVRVRREGARVREEHRADGLPRRPVRRHRGCARLRPAGAPRRGLPGHQGRAADLAGRGGRRLADPRQQLRPLPGARASRSASSWVAPRRCPARSTAS